jgi:hypothetical protein
MRFVARVALLAYLLLLTPLGLAGAGDEVGNRAPGWPDNFITRLEALALLQTLNADLLSHDSAHPRRLHRESGRLP